LHFTPLFCVLPTERKPVYQVRIRSWQPPAPTVTCCAVEDSNCNASSHNYRYLAFKMKNSANSALSDYLPRLSRASEHASKPWTNLSQIPVVLAPNPLTDTVGLYPKAHVRAVAPCTRMRGPSIFRGWARWRKVPIRAGIEILAINDIDIAVQAAGNRPDRTVQTGVESDALAALRFLRGTDLLVLAFARVTGRLTALRLSRHSLGRAKHAPLGEVLRRRWRHPMIVEPDVFLPAESHVRYKQNSPTRIKKMWVRASSSELFRFTDRSGRHEGSYFKTALLIIVV